MYNSVKSKMRKLINPGGAGNFTELYRGSAIALGIKLFGFLLGYIFSLLVAKTFGASLLGNFMIGITILSFLGLLSCFGMETGIVAYTARAKAVSDYPLIKKILTAVLIPSVFISLLLLILAWIAINELNLYFGKLSPDSVIITNILLLVLPFYVAYRIMSNFFRGLKQILIYSLLNYATTYITALILLIIALIAFNVTGALLSATFAIAIAVSFFTAVILLFRVTKNFPAGDIKGQITKSEIPVYSFPILISDLLKNGRNWMVVLLVGYLMTEKEVGVLGIALKLTFAPSLLINAVNSIAMPKFSEQFTLNNIDELKKTLAESARVIFWSSFPVLVGIFFFSSLILKFLGNEFEMDPVLIFTLVVGVFFEVISGSSAYFLQMVGKQKVNTYFLLLSSLLLLILLLILIPGYGITGAVISVTISFVIYSISLVLYAKYAMGFSTYYFPFKAKLKSLLKI